MRDFLNALLVILRIPRLGAFFIGKISDRFTASLGKPDLSAPTPRFWRLKQVKLVLTLLLLMLLTSAGFLAYRAYAEGQEIRAYVGGPFSSQLLYMQGCAPGAAGSGAEANIAPTLGGAIQLLPAVYRRTCRLLYIRLQHTKVSRAFRKGYGTVEKVRPLCLPRLSRRQGREKSDQPL